MDQYKTEYKIIDFESESYPLQWSTLNRTEPHSEDCCHGCEYLDMNGFYERGFFTSIRIRIKLNSSILLRKISFQIQDIKN